MGSEQGASCPRVWEGLHVGEALWLLLTHFKIQDLILTLFSLPYNQRPLLTTSG